MSVRSLLQRAARKVARGGAQPWRKQGVIAAAAAYFLARGNFGAAVRAFRYLCGLPARSATGKTPAGFAASAVKLIQYSFPAWGDSIGVAGPAKESVIAALNAAGYSNAAAAYDENESTLATFGELESIPRRELRQALAKLANSPAETMITAIPLFPDDLLESFESGQPVRVLETREWWNQQFQGHGLEAQNPPKEPLELPAPFLLTRSRPKPTAERIRPRVSQPEAIFVMPEMQNAFRWVTESLADALTSEGCPARVVSPAEAGEHPFTEAPRKITWAHFWPQYREIQVESGRHYEFFVTNFHMNPRRGRTPWVEDLVRRNSVKLAPTQFCREVLVGLGVPSDQIHLIPHGYSPEFAQPAEPLPLATHKRFRFLAVVNSHDPFRYGLDVMVSAYRRAFTADDDVCLVVKDYGGANRETAALLATADGPEILYYSNFISKTDLARFYAACDACVSPYRGEGFGMKILDAVLKDLPLILPLFGGPVDYCPADLVQPVKFQLSPVGRCLETENLEWKEDLEWAEPDLDDLAAAMRAVFERQAEFAAKAGQLKRQILEAFHWNAAAKALIRAFEQDQKSQ